MENTKNTSKESYLTKLKNTLVKHFTNTIKSEIQEYKDNMDLKYDLPVKTKESLAAYVQEMVKFNGSGKVSEKIRATKEELKVLCNEKSVGRFEFYQAARAGFKPQLILEIHSFENNNPFEVIFKNKKYSVIKEYTSKDITELTCEELKNENR